MCVHLKEEWGSSEKSDILDGKIKITDAHIEAIVASLSSLSPINRYLLSNNIEGQGVYIPETVTVASSSSQISRNQFLVPVPDPICSTRIFPEVSHKNVLQSKSESVHDHDLHEVEPMEIEISQAQPHESQKAWFVPCEKYRICSNNDTTVPMEEHSVPNERQHDLLPSYEHQALFNYCADPSISLSSAVNYSHQEDLQIEHTEDSMINALDIGLTPVDDDKESRLNKSMDVS